MKQFNKIGEKIENIWRDQNYDDAEPFETILVQVDENYKFVRYL